MYQISHESVGPFQREKETYTHMHLHLITNFYIYTICYISQMNYELG